MTTTKKMKPFTITLDWLVAQGACPDQRNTFRKTFGTRVRVTEEVIMKHGQKFQMDWLIHKLCTHVGDSVYDNGVSELWAKYWADRCASDDTFRLTKKGYQRMRIDYDAMKKAARPFQRARDKACNELTIRVLRDYRKA